MSSDRPWIGRVEFAVRQPIKGHGRRPREDHAEQDAQQILPAKRRLTPGQQRGEQRKGQCEQRVAEADQFQQMADLVEHCG